MGETATTTVRSSSMEKLPSDILRNILCRLPVESLAKVRYVCKTWFYIIVERGGTCPFNSFSKMHLNHLRRNSHLPSTTIVSHFHDARRSTPAISDLHLVHLKTPSLDKPSSFRMPCISSDFYNGDHHLSIVGSCDGLLCLGRTRIGPEIVCNPLLPDDFLHLQPNCDRLAQFFGFDVSSERISPSVCFPPILAGFAPDPLEMYTYKVVRIISMYDMVAPYDRFRSECDVCTVSCNKANGDSFMAGEWRHVEKFPYPLELHQKGILAAGRLHWKGMSDYIVSFDVHHENFHMFPLPMFSEEDEVVMDFGLGDLGGRLSLVVTSPDERQIHIWVMKEYGKGESWERDYVISLTRRAAEVAPDYRPLCLWGEDDEVLIEWCRERCISYNLRTDTVKEIEFHGCNAEVGEVSFFPHVCSILSVRPFQRRRRVTATKTTTLASEP